VEEESTSAGALYLREQIAADAVIIGEPSGSRAITVGYYGLLKLAVRCELPVGHTAGREALTGADRMIAVLNRVRASIAACAPDALVATLGVHAVNAGDVHAAEAVVDVRVPPQVDPLQLVDVVLRATPEESVEVLRCTAAVRTSRADGLVRAFARAISATGAVPRFVAKKGSCDMNTLGARWPSVPWLAYGPGDSSLDHTPSEHLDATEFRLASRVLLDALGLWLRASGPALQPRTSTTRRLTNATS
jgi:LysW-gamma-L-lysine carboxypeptidase